MIFIHSQFLSNLRLGNKMFIFSMYRNCVFRVDERINKLDVFLTGMTRYMNILENNFSTFSHQFVDDSGYGLFISRDRAGTEYDRIIWLNGNFSVHARCHAGKRSHRFSLASRCDNDGLFIRIIAKLVCLDQYIIRKRKISEFRSD